MWNPVPCRNYCFHFLQCSRYWFQSTFLASLHNLNAYSTRGELCNRDMIPPNTSFLGFHSSIMLVLITYTTDRVMQNKSHSSMSWRKAVCIFTWFHNLGFTSFSFALNTFVIAWPHCWACQIGQTLLPESDGPSSVSITPIMWNRWGTAPSGNTVKKRKKIHTVPIVLARYCGQVFRGGWHLFVHKVHTNTDEQKNILQEPDLYDLYTFI